MKLSKLKYYITAEGISQRELAKAININLRTLNFKLNGRGEFTISEIIKVKNFLKLDKDKFCELFEFFFE